jgi:copper chaperone CopZ
MTETPVKVQGMHCVDCAHKVEDAIRQVTGVKAVHVHYLKKQAKIESDGALNWERIQEDVRAAGYDVILPSA